MALTSIFGLASPLRAALMEAADRRQRRVTQPSIVAAVEDDDTDMDTGPSTPTPAAPPAPQTPNYVSGGADGLGDAGGDFGGPDNVTGTVDVSSALGFSGAVDTVAGPGSGQAGLGNTPGIQGSQAQEALQDAAVSTGVATPTASFAEDTAPSLGPTPSSIAGVSGMPDDFMEQAAASISQTVAANQAAASQTAPAAPSIAAQTVQDEPVAAAVTAPAPPAPAAPLSAVTAQTADTSGGIADVGPSPSDVAAAAGMSGFSDPTAASPQGIGTNTGSSGGGVSSGGGGGDGGGGGGGGQGGPGGAPSGPGSAAGGVGQGGDPAGGAVGAPGADPGNDNDDDNDGDGPGGGGAGGCVVATALVETGAWAPEARSSVVRWCVRELHGSARGNTARRGYRATFGPVAKLMRRSPIARSAMQYLFGRFSDHVTGRAPNIVGAALYRGLYWPMVLIGKVNPRA